nr:DUF2281 domain-containing protein [Bacillota bacterium]
MQKTAKSLEEVVKELPPDLQEEVRDFANFLLQKRAARPRRKPKFDWARGLKELRDKYTSVELQHRASEWRTDKQ